MVGAQTIGAIAAFAAVALAGCGPDPEPPQDGGPDASHGCTLPFLGDQAKDPVIQLVALDADMKLVELKDGDPVALVFPPQGGRVVFAGVRATNVDACGLQLAGAVRDTTTKQVRVDTRTVNLLPSGDGWGASDPEDISTFSNVPLCPNQWSMTNIYGTPYELEIAITDRGGRKASQKITVTPECSEPAHAAECLCICKGGYMLGETCADAGAPDGGDGGI
jgi:hypothetical protein